MGRPAPKIIQERVKDKKKYLVEQITSVEGVWAIFYDGQPCNLRTKSLASNANPRYRGTVFTSEGSGNAMVVKFNIEYRTDKFSLVQLY